MDGFKKWITRICSYCDTAGGIVLAAIMALVTLNVITRLLGAPIKGTVEWVQFLLSASIGLTMAYCALEEGHIIVGLVVDKFPAKIRLIVGVFVNLIIVAFVLMVSWMLLQYGFAMRDKGQLGMVTRLPYYPFIYLTAFGFLLYAFVALNKIFQFFNKGGDK